LPHWTSPLDDLTAADIAARLAAHIPAPPQDPYPRALFNRPRRRAGVLLPLTRVEAAWHLLYIRRTEHEGDMHGGQVAFPGGGMDPGDASVEAAALREASEEVGLRPPAVQVLGVLDEFITISNNHVTPVVGAFESPYPFIADRGEVARVFTIPLAWLAAPEHHEVRYRSIPPHEPWPVIYFDEYDGELLWGFTAHLTLRFLEIIGG
jgi:8-oxo-dGTP pyrophosphatase MutT (NUDIX family)